MGASYLFCGLAVLASSTSVGLLS
uniref:Uncharacterized protein n=1 Tax=Anguilla anguilla TaxID=7936 RepID=A0A0E9SES7_ANGAN